MAKRLNTMQVLRTERLSPHFVRVYLGGEGFDDFLPVRGRDDVTEDWDTDMYVKIVFMPDGSAVPADVDPADLRGGSGEPGEPVLRTYTIRSYDPVRRELAIDFVVHGDEGIAGPWAQRAQPGETVRFLGPGSGYKPRADAPWHLFACDESGLPAVAAALAALPDDARGQAFVEVAGPEDELPLTVPAGVGLTWIHRGGGAGEVDDDRAGDNAPLIAAVRDAPWWDGEPQVFIHGEAQAVMHNLRGYIRKERGVGAANASISGYWRRGRTEEGFRRWKADLRKAEEQATA
ncbi:putative siderophore-interacting protein [Gordonia araii NBRC 100433]|uniref:Putative siderophore-interacting protein n=1 Tax=Gordonia araii NBRC 100433 TaxID=1073574 RepID=G7H523_9ACTN|nr:siderophore-interacting protein [Gordonia araii]NNG96638.1 siderophore-interacting protein [Gordonia araii NBRC 100433]GAB10948.1 putative siderophore-interacting protein [Gordonia araii NBRC 100433]